MRAYSFLKPLTRLVLAVAFAGALPALVLGAGPQARPAAPPSGAQTTTKFAGAPITSKVLGNGLEIIVYEDHSVPIVTVELAVRNGSFTEPPELNGLSHLYEHMFFSPNLAERDKADYLKDINQLGISYNGATQEEVVEYFFTTTTPNFPVEARLLRDSTLLPAFDQRDFARERDVVIGEMDRRDANPFGALSKEMMDRLFSKYPSRKEPLGNRATVGTATTDMMRLIQGRYYVPNNSAVVITGDVAPAAAFTVIEGLFGEWARRKVDPFVEFPLVEHPPLAKSDGAILTQPIQNIVVDLGWQGPSVGKDDAATYAADVFSFILQQPDSHFQRALVDTGLVSGVEIGYYTQRNVGPIRITLQTTPDKARAAVKAVYTEIAHFNDPAYYTDEELASGKALLEADNLYSREKLSEYVHEIAFWWSSTGFDYFRGYLGHVRTTTRADISRYVTTYIQGKPHIGLALLSDASLKVSGLTVDDLIGGGK